MAEMRIPHALRQVFLSGAVFAGVILAVASVDARVRERARDMLHTGSPAQVGDVVDALVTAARYHTMDNAPLVVFAAAGALLFVFMFRT
jgi:hypothetical protein